MAFSILATPQELATIVDLDTLRAFSGLDDEPWAAVSLCLGTIPNLRVLAMTPVATLQTAIQTARVTPPVAGLVQPPDRELSSVEVTQLALTFRGALQKFGLPDTDPLQTVAQAPMQGGQDQGQGQGQGQGQNQLQQSILTGQRRKVKANTILDQADDGEVTLLPQAKVDESFRQLRAVKGGEPTLDAEPTPDQVSAMTERLIQMDMEPYADFALFTPFGRRFQKQLKLKNWILDADGTYHPVEVPGPKDYDTWHACWRVYANCLLMIVKQVVRMGQSVNKVVMTLAALEKYQESFRKLAVDLPECWHLCAIAEDRCRAEHFQRLRRKLILAHAKGLAPDFDEDVPWIVVMEAAADDDKFKGSRTIPRRRGTAATSLLEKALRSVSASSRASAKDLARTNGHTFANGA